MRAAVMPSKMARARGASFGFAILALLFLSLYLSAESQSSASPTAQASWADMSGQSTSAYRSSLERSTSPRSLLTRSKSMTFDRIYCLSLPSRHDRREQMRKLARALDLEFHFVDAANKTEPFVGWIAERVAEVRKQKRKVMAQVRGVAESSLGGLQIDSDWLSLTADVDGLVPFEPLSSSLYGDVDWVAYLEENAEAATLEELHSSSASSSKGSSGALNVTRLLYDHQEKHPLRQQNAGTISTYFGHVRAIRRMLKNGDDTALFLEDDVDIEWDVYRLWAHIERRLPSHWEAVFLGHCWGREILNPALGHPLLHESTQPLCLHGYALSKAGAKKLLSYLSNPWVAYQTPVDTVLPFLIQHKLIQSYSVEPPLIIQNKASVSDIQSGAGSAWRGVLMDSTLERLMMDEGTPIPSINFLDDPARQFRLKLANEENCARLERASAKAKRPPSLEKERKRKKVDN